MSQRYFRLLLTMADAVRQYKLSSTYLIQWLTLTVMPLRTIYDILLLGHILVAIYPLDPLTSKPSETALNENIY